MVSLTPPSDPLESVPDPESVRVLLAEAIRRRDLLRSLLRVAVRKAAYPPPAPRVGRPHDTDTDREGSRRV
jgi:hypothetical protein